MVSPIGRSELRDCIQSLLLSGDKKGASELIWPWLVPNEWRDRIYKALDHNDYLAIMGHGSAAKTFTSSEWFLLDWWTDPANTALVITSDTLGSMDRRIWSDIKMLWSRTSVPMGGILIDSKRMIVHSHLDKKNAVAGIAAEDKDSQTKIQGIHTKRIRVVIDEADNKDSQSIWKAISNLGTSGELKVCALANPVNRTSEFGQHCEPKEGWSAVDPETAMEWDSRKGWHVLRLDGLRSPNIVAKKDVYPFLLTQRGVEDIKSKKGVHSSEWWAYVRAFYSPSGDSRTIFSPDLLASIRKPFIWYAATTPIGMCDPALEDGGDGCILGLGKMGRLAAESRKTACKLEKTHRIMRKNLDKPATIDKGDQIIFLLKQHGVRPENFIIDCTGEGRGISDYIKSAWDDKKTVATVDVRFGGNATEMTLTTEDTKPASEIFDRFVSELWYVAREWCRLGLVWVDSGIAVELDKDLEARTYELLGGDGKISIESKKEMKKRGLESPDHGDMFCLMIHLVRMLASGFKPGIFSHEKKDPMRRFKKMAYVSNASYGVKPA